MYFKNIKISPLLFVQKIENIFLEMSNVVFISVFREQNTVKTANFQLYKIKLFAHNIFTKIAIKKTKNN